MLCRSPDLLANSALLQGEPMAQFLSGSLIAVSGWKTRFVSKSDFYKA